MVNSIISIVGRPNVGKSTLFNRLIGKRKSIVSPEAGVTRDRIYDTFIWRDKKFGLIDTGGYFNEKQDLMNNKIKEQVFIAIEESETIIFVVDGRSELTSNDYILAKSIQKSRKPFHLVVNKIDDAKFNINAMQFYELGLGEPSLISAQNNRSIGDMLDKIMDIVPESIQKHEYNNSINLAIVGSPNVGKSSLVNRLINQDKSIVTNIPGTTRDSVDSYIKYFGKNIRIIDTAGLRRKTKVDNDIEYYSNVRTFKVIDECDIAVVMVDASRGVNKMEQKILEHIIIEGKGMMVIINKWDLIKKDSYTVKNYTQDIYDQIPALSNYPIHFISVKNNFRVRNLLKDVDIIYKIRKQKISTSVLNDFVKKISSQNPPPAVKSKHIKIKYITQMKHSPPSFILFTNYPDLFPEHYKRYIYNQLIKSFNFKGTPLRLFFRKSE